VIEPLQVVDRYQNRGLRGELFDDRDERGSNRTLIGYRAVSAHPQ
jgi:hypothetical protein